MNVTFRTSSLGKAYKEFTHAQRLWGEKVARAYIRRVNLLFAADSVADLRRVQAVRFHALKGDRSGQYAMNLTERYRLIASFEDQKMTIVKVEEVSKHYGD